MEKIINIALSKKKLIKNIFLSIVIIMLCIFFYFSSNWLFKSKIEIITFKIIGSIGILYFSITLFFYIQKMKDKKFGLTLNEIGFIDNTSATSVGLIKWEDIIGFKEFTFETTKNLIVLVINNEVYLKKATNIFSKKMLQANCKGFGSPIAIAATSLSINYEEMTKIIFSQYEKCRHK
jgi:hypothetical protein